MPSICARCVKNGGGCCNSHESGIFVTLHDALRIKKATGLDYKEFLSFSNVPKKWFKYLRKTNNPFLEMFCKKKILQLKLTKEGCPFLGPEGCEVFKHRPGVCRLHPIDYELFDDGRVGLSLADDPDCLVVKECGGDVKGALKSLGERENSFKRFAKKDDEESDLYLDYKALIAEGVSYDEIIKKFKIKA